MNLPALGHSSMIAGAKLFLAAVSPLQSFLDQPGLAHEFCNRQAAVILANEGYQDAAQLIQSYLVELNAGVYWADKGWKNVCHYYEPVSGRGLWQFNHALEAFDGYYSRSLACLSRGGLPDALFFLGAAAHLLQDLCVPHHARAKIFNGHKEYESWVKEHYQRYALDQARDLHQQAPIAKILQHNAAMAADLYDWVDSEQGGLKYHQVTGIALPQAQWTTASLFLEFHKLQQQAVSSVCITVA